MEAQSPGPSHMLSRLSSGGGDPRDSEACRLRCPASCSGTRGHGALEWPVPRTCAFLTKDCPVHDPSCLHPKWRFCLGFYILQPQRSFSYTLKVEVDKNTGGVQGGGESHGENQLPKNRNDPLGETWGAGVLEKWAASPGKGPGVSARLGVCRHSAARKESGGKAPPHQRGVKATRAHACVRRRAALGGPPPPGLGGRAGSAP